MSQGGSFLDGFEDGAFSGAVGGAIGGAAFSGLGVAGSTLGKGISCASKLGKVIKGTAAVSKVLSLGMAGVDMISLADMAIDNKNNPIADLNKKLHSSKAYNIFQTSVSALAVFTGGMTTTMSCFIAGTLVATKKGKIPIEEVKCNDWVLSAAPNTLRKSYKRVENIFNRQVDFLIHLYISGDEIVTSDNHPFYIVGKGFVAASLLCVGMQLIDAKGDVHVLENIYREQCNSKVCVYNFTVEDFHTYFIGQNTILVHNAECNVAFNKKSKYDQKEYEQQERLLMNRVNAYKFFLDNLKVNGKDISRALTNQSDKAIEFIQYLKNDTTRYAALVMQKNKAVRFIPMFTLEEIEQEELRYAKRGYIFQKNHR